MEFFALLEACGCLLEAANGLVALADLVVWIFSEENRTERRDAKREGRTPPPRNGWTIALLVLVPVTVVLLILLVIRYVVPR